ncbi:hypothetical protein SPF06_16535 [Sinomonas sp. JGH33]|uniref:Uncharacterized protein n=1 Tax=Sinomonas terricola TaxID=3110330 RepID=A0ABU5TA03_9MICC|nr:hypothetical protein [Sinomonas sp. JGH33]MEA5456344.1 hypothetical protein [Sinomonas sp. JGH33]
MASLDHGSTVRRPNEREDPAGDFQVEPPEKSWDEEDGLFDGEEIVIG